MAKVHGIEIKNIKSFEGMEGKIYQGNMYLNGKKIGFWSQDLSGGEDRYDFKDRRISSKKLNDLVEKTCPPITYLGYTTETNLSILMEDIVMLNQVEKDWRKFKKEGNPIMILTDFPNLGEYMEHAYSDDLTLAQAFDAAQKQVEANPRYNDQDANYYLFANEDCFEIGDSFDLDDIMEVA